MRWDFFPLPIDLAVLRKEFPLGLNLGLIQNLNPVEY